MKTYFDIQGDGGSDILGQVHAFHGAIAESLSGVRRRVAIGSGKGGVGKSSVTMALAQVLRR
ncbi:MAG: P-loop NTPase, partial [Thermoanaerobaculia bacterium]|nr:P-loop NTPase [Thermoanaerobaculia bacterium]